jgi:hypothetical protein
LYLLCFLVDVCRISLRERAKVQLLNCLPRKLIATFSTALDALNNLKAKLKAAFSKKGKPAKTADKPAEAKPTETKPADTTTAAAAAPAAEAAAAPAAEAPKVDATPAATEAPKAEAAKEETPAARKMILSTGVKEMVLT